MSYMFSYCIFLSDIPDISVWKIKKTNNLRGMFFMCNFVHLPDISKWKIDKRSQLCYIFTKDYITPEDSEKISKISEKFGIGKGYLNF